MHVGRISIAGGEPFICKDLFPFLERCKEKGMGVSISTNATLLSEEVVKQLNSYEIKTITVSVDGGNTETMDYVRGKGSYRKTLEGLANLQKFYKYNYSIKTTLMKSNIESLESIINLAISFSCNNIKFNCVREDGRAQNNKDSILLTQEEYISTIEMLEEFKIKYKEKISVKTPLNIFCTEPYDFVDELGFGCFAGKESCYVDPMGNVRPCAHFPNEFICGNVLVQPMEEIWLNSSILQEFRLLVGNNTCIECKDYRHCRSGCRHRAYMNGNINGIDPFCYKMLNKISYNI